jgi:hypothetical protein
MIILPAVERVIIFHVYFNIRIFYGYLHKLSFNSDKGFGIMLRGSLVTTAWRVLRLWMETATRYGG